MKPDLRLIQNEPRIYLPRPFIDEMAWLESRIRPPVKSKFERICDWLGHTFGESPRGFAFFAATLLPLTIAAFAVGYFGLRDLLAIFGV